MTIFHATVPAERPGSECTPLVKYGYVYSGERNREDTPLHWSQRSFLLPQLREVLRPTSHPIEKFLSRKGAATFSVSRTLHLDPGNPREEWL